MLLIPRLAISKGEPKIEEVDRKVNLSEIPLLEYDEATFLYVDNFVSLFNADDYRTIYGMFSKNLAEEIDFTQTQELIKYLRVLFGKINYLEEIKMPTSEVSLRDPNNHIPYLLSTLNDWETFLENNFKVRIYKAVCDKMEGYLLIALSNDDNEYKIEAFNLSAIKQ